jgi:hypothetical protein
MTEPSPGPAAETYRDQVADIMDSRAADVPYPPGAPELTVVNRRLATSTADLNEAEIVQLRACWAMDGMDLADALSEPECSVEAAEVVDASARCGFACTAGTSASAGCSRPTGWTWSRAASSTTSSTGHWPSATCSPAWTGRCEPVTTAFASRCSSAGPRLVLG